MIVCPCGKEFEYHRGKKYCSPECKQHAKNMVRAPRPIKKSGRRPQRCVHGILGVEHCAECVRNRSYNGEKRRRQDPEYAEQCRINSNNWKIRQHSPAWLQHFETQFNLQQGNCAICGDIVLVKPCRDRNHKTGQWRGVLCRSCNLGLGHVEKTGWLEKVLEYLKKWETTNGGF
jgi:hypothetical protein